MVGGSKTSDFNEYFKTLEKYINGIRDLPHNLSIIDNFSSLFTLIATHEGSSELTKETIKRYIKEYLISSMIDINESVLELDFDISL
jgi:hypothetical protein